MKYYEYEKAFSPARLNKYLVACGGNTTKALMLYRHKVKLCQKFYGILNVFEVVLRNAINAHYQNIFNDLDWVENQMRHGGMIENAPQKNEVLRIIPRFDRMGDIQTIVLFRRCLSASGHICSLASLTDWAVRIFCVYFRTAQPD